MHQRNGCNYCCCDAAFVLFLPDNPLDSNALEKHMPIYEYRCGSCGLKKDHLQKHSDAPIAACPECGSEQYAKQLSAAGFQLKGSGWYATDFKGGSCPAVSESKSDSSASTTPPCGGSCACH
jgi:putative FmdB family regulatory protein